MLWSAVPKRRRLRLGLRALFLILGLIGAYATSVLVQEKCYWWGGLTTGLVILTAIAEFVLADILTDRIYPVRTQAVLERLENDLRGYHDRIRGAIERCIQSLAACNHTAVSGTFHLKVDLYSPYNDEAEQALVQVVDYSGNLGGRKWRFNPMTKGLIGRCARTQQPECVNFATEDEYCQRMVTEFGFTQDEVRKHTKEARSYWAQPVFDAHTFVGVIFLFSTEQQVFPRAASDVSLNAAANEISAYLEGARIV